jgi:hypothetical protein
LRIRNNEIMRKNRKEVMILDTEEMMEEETDQKNKMV